MNSSYRDYMHVESGPANGAAGLALTEQYVELTRRLKGVQHICDLGCGNGYLASRLGSVGLSVTGIDASETGIEIANRLHSTDRVAFVCAEIGPDLATLPQTGRRFDAVISGDVVEHLYRPSDLVTIASALLKPGGYLIIGTPYHGYLKNLALSVFDKWDSHHGVHWDGGHIKFFSVRTLRELVSRNGFVDVRFSFYGRLPWLWKNMICIAKLPPATE